MHTTIIISGCASIKDNLAQLCVSSGLDVLVVPNIYHLPEQDAIWPELAMLKESIILISPLHPRPAEWLFRKRWAGEQIKALNISDYASAEECHGAIVELLNEGSCVHGSQFSVLSSPSPIADRWYPILDRSRCKNCRNCLQFCLFGVYEMVGELVKVCKPDSCKPGCPACSRICPEGAIMFPLCAQSAAIAGAPGMMMSPDAAARRMYYARTKAACPACGSSEDIRAQETAGAKICEECGRPILSNANGSDIFESDLADELDQLIDDLDSITRKD